MMQRIDYYRNSIEIVTIICDILAISVPHIERGLMLQLLRER